MNDAGKYNPEQGMKLGNTGNPGGSSSRTPMAKGTRSTPSRLTRTRPPGWTSSTSTSRSSALGRRLLMLSARRRWRKRCRELRLDSTRLLLPLGPLAPCHLLGGNSFVAGSSPSSRGTAKRCSSLWGTLYTGLDASTILLENFFGNMIFLVFRSCMGQLLTLPGCTTTSLSIDSMAVLGPLLELGVCL